jgi:hypothetical protein
MDDCGDGSEGSRTSGSLFVNPSKSEKPAWNEVRTFVMILNGEIVGTTGIPRANHYLPFVVRKDSK